jgi:hypothetical protein
MATTTPGTLSMNVGGQKWIATPTSSTTAAQTAAATSAGWQPVATGTKYKATGPSVQGGTMLPTSGSTTPEVAPKIEVGKLKSPTAPMTPAYQPDLASPDAFTQSLTPETLTPDEQKAANLKAEVDKKWQEYQGMGEDYQNMQNQYQIPQNLQKIQEVQNTILQLNKNFAATNAQLAGQAIPTPIILKQQEVNRSAAAAEIGAYSAYAQALQGNIEMATKLIDQSIQIKYKPMEARLNYLIREGDAQRAYMDKKDERQWELAKINLQNQYQSIRDEKNAKLELAKSSMSLIKDGILPQSVLNDILNADSADAAFKNIAKMTGSTEAEARQFLSMAKSKSNIDEITNVLESGALRNAVGTSFLSRGGTGFWGNVGRAITIAGIPSAIGGLYRNLTGEQQDFIGGVEQLRSQLNLDTLINAKKNGATFGALSNQELQVLASAATKLGTWAIKDDDGNVVGYNTSESAFRTELDKINNYAKLDYLLKGGNPQDVGLQILPDGTIWAINSDNNSLTQIR